MLTNKNSAGTLLPQAFTFNASNQQVRTVMLDGEPYFVAKDVCDILQLTNSRVAIQSVDDDERRKYYLHPSQEMWFINESGFYHLVFLSRKPQAVAIRKWVTSEVLPTLRRTGHYGRALPVECDGQDGGRRRVRYERPTVWLDLRSEPYEIKPLNGFPVRVVVHEGVEWYLMNDVKRALGVFSGSYRNAATLNLSGVPLARKIHIYGISSPAWFTTRAGVRLLVSSHRRRTAESFMSSLFDSCEAANRNQSTL